MAVGNQRADADLSELVWQAAGLVAENEGERAVHLLHGFIQRHGARQHERKEPPQRILRAILLEGIEVAHVE